MYGYYIFIACVFYSFKRLAVFFLYIFDILFDIFCMQTFLLLMIGRLFVFALGCTFFVAVIECLHSVYDHANCFKQLFDVLPNSYFSGVNFVRTQP